MKVTHWAGACATLSIALALLLAEASVAASCSRGIANVQRSLADLHYAVGPVDGCRGPRTALAIQAFQRVNGLSSDGELGRATRRALHRPRVLRPAVSALGSHIEVDLSRQILLRVRNGRVAAIYAAATGRRGHATPAGRFRVQRKERRSWSREHHVWLRWASYFHRRGFAIHAGRVNRYAASHGCVRVAREFAPEIYHSVLVAALVVIRRRLG